MAKIGRKDHLLRFKSPEAKNIHLPPALDSNG
jgi:hypothetical protein